MTTFKSKPRSSLRGLRTFCVAARHESFRLAAEELFVTSSAVSHQVKSLEQELGLQLFERGTRDLKLTPSGAALFDELAPLIDDIDNVVATHRTAGRRQTIRISVQPFFASEFFVPRLREFTQEHPETDIHVGTSDESSDKHPADADLSVRLFKTPPADLESDLLFPLRMIPSGSPSFRKKLVVEDGEIRSAFPLIVHATRPNAWRDWSRSSGIRIPSGSKVTRLDSMIAIVRAVEQGIGAALVPVPIAGLWFEQGSIEALFDDELVADVSYYLVSKAGKKPGPETDLLRQWILENFAE